MEKQKAPCLVKITQCSTKSWWYNNLIGAEFETDMAAEGKDYVVWEDYINKHAIWRHIKHEDCKIVKLNNINIPPDIKQ